MASFILVNPSFYPTVSAAQWHLLTSIELLSSGLCVTDVAYWLEFASHSAFIAFFKSRLATRRCTL